MDKFQILGELKDIKKEIDNVRNNKIKISYIDSELEKINDRIFNIIESLESEGIIPIFS